jgi:hypothetical protein
MDNNREKQFCVTQNDISTLSNKEKSDRVSTPVKSFVNTYKNVKKDKKDLSQSNISNISDDKSAAVNRSIISNASFIKAEKVDFNKVYSKREKAELYMIRGIPREFKKFEANSYKCEAFHFVKPTSLILDTDKFNIDRYKPSTDFFKKSIINTKHEVVEHERTPPQTDRQSNIRII